MKDKKGFTLIELMIVIMIIGILAAIAIPAFLGQKEKAKVRIVKKIALGNTEDLAKFQGTGWWDDMAKKLKTDLIGLNEKDYRKYGLDKHEAEAILRFFKMPLPLETETTQATSPKRNATTPVALITEEDKVKEVVRVIIEGDDLTFEQLEVYQDNRKKVEKRVVELRELRREANRL